MKWRKKIYHDIYSIVLEDRRGYRYRGKGSLAGGGILVVHLQFEIVLETNFYAEGGGRDADTALSCTEASVKLD